MYLNLYTFKRSSLLQSIVIAFLSISESDHGEKSNLRILFKDLDTESEGLLSADNISKGVMNVKDTFRKQLGKKEGFEANWQEVVSAISPNAGKISF